MTLRPISSALLAATLLTAGAAAAQPGDAAKVEPERPKAPPILVTQATNATLEAAWTSWRSAAQAKDEAALEKAEAALRTLKAETGALGLESFAVGISRAAAARREANDPSRAVHFAMLAVELAPALPYAHLELARTYFAADPSEPGRILSELKAALVLSLGDPRYARPLVTDLGASLLVALIATAAAVILMLFVRRARYFFHDFHHLFPRVAAPWQSAAFAALLLLLPLVFRAGPLPMLLALFFAVAMYLSLPERIVGASLLVLVALVPLLGGLLVEHTAFAGTPAEDVHRLERGGTDTQAAEQRLAARVKEGRASFGELYALARYRYRRGELTSAVDLFKQAAAARPNDARTLTNLGNALLAQGDEESALTNYNAAFAADNTLAAAAFNLSRVYYRRAKSATDLEVGAALDRAQTTSGEAQRLNPELLTRTDPPDDNLQANLLLLSPELPVSELGALASSSPQGEAVSRQLSSQLVGAASALEALLLGAGLGLLVFAVSFARRSLGTSRACEQCGRAVCRRCDPELGLGSLLCIQCVSVFARKSAVPPPMKVKKQHEVARYQTRLGRLSYLFGLLCSGAGHVFAGTPVRGALYAFVFLFVLINFFFRAGVLRPPFGSAPELFRLVPLGLLFALVYLLTLRGLYRRQTES